MRTSGPIAFVLAVAFLGASPDHARLSASAYAREGSSELRRDLDEAASGREVGPDAPASSDEQ